MNIDQVRALIAEKEDELSTLRETLARLLATASADSDPEAGTIFPFDRAPAEILGEIFSHCIHFWKPPFGEEQSRSPPTCLRQGQLRLMHVSQAWREVVSSTPSFWTCLSLDLGRRSPASSYNSVVPLTELWLQNSRNLLIDIEVHSHCFNGYLRRVEPLLAVLNLTASHVHRWRSCRLLPSEPYSFYGTRTSIEELEVSLDFLPPLTATFPNPLPLESFTSNLASVYSIPQNHATFHALAHVIRSAPKLRQVAWIDHPSLLFNGCPPSRSLTHLTMGNEDHPIHFEATAVAHLLAGLQSLQDLSVHIDEQLQFSVEGADHNLPALTHLSIMHMGDIPTFLRAFGFPQLKSLRMRQLSDVNEAGNNHEIVSLLARSSCAIDTLDLDVSPGSFHLTDLLRHPSVQPSLRNLKLGNEFEDVAEEMEHALLNGVLFPSLIQMDITMNLPENGDVLRALLLEWTKLISRGEMILQTFKATFFIPTSEERINHVEINYQIDRRMKQAMDGLQAVGVKAKYSEEVP